MGRIKGLQLINRIKTYYKEDFRITNEGLGRIKWDYILYTYSPKDYMEIRLERGLQKDKSVLQIGLKRL